MSALSQNPEFWFLRSAGSVLGALRLYKTIAGSNYNNYNNM